MPARRKTTHVFPYKAIQPILSIDSSGALEVSPFDDPPVLENLNSIQEAISEIRTSGSMRRFDESIAGVRDEIRRQREMLEQILPQLRVNTEPQEYLRQIEMIRVAQGDILDKLSALIEKHAGKIHIEQGFETVIQDMKSITESADRLKNIGETVKDIQDTSKTLVQLVRDMPANGPSNEFVDTVMEHYRQIKDDLRELQARGVPVSPPVAVDDWLSKLQADLVSKMETDEDRHKQILREIGQLTDILKTIGDLKTAPQSPELLDSVQRVSKELSQIPKIDQGELLEGVRDAVRELGTGPVADLQTRLDALTNIANMQLETLNTFKIARDLETGKPDEDKHDQILRGIGQLTDILKTIEDLKTTPQSPELLGAVQRVSRELSQIPKIDQGVLLEGVRDIVKELGADHTTDMQTRLDALTNIANMQLETLNTFKIARDLETGKNEEIQKALLASSRIQIIEESIKILVDRPVFNEKRILRAIEEIQNMTNGEDIVKRLENLEKTLSGREDMRRGFEELKTVAQGSDVKLEGLVNGLKTIQELSEQTIATQLSILSKMENMNSNEDAEKILGYQQQLKKYENEKSEFEKKLEALTLELKECSSKKTIAEARGLTHERERGDLTKKIVDLNAQLSDIQKEKTKLEGDLRDALKDKTIIDPRISELELKIAALTADNNAMGGSKAQITELETEVANLKSRLETQSLLEIEKKQLEEKVESFNLEMDKTRRLLEDRTKEAETVRRDCAEYKRRMDELVGEVSEMQKTLSKYESDHMAYMSLTGRIDELILRRKVDTEKVEYVDRLADLIESFNHDEKVVTIQEETVITDIPRYAVYPSIDKIMQNLRNPDADDSVTRELFKQTKAGAETKLFNYHQQVERTRNTIKGTLQTSNFLHGIRNLILTNPQYLSDFKGASTPPKVGSSVDKLDKRPIDVQGVGKFVLVNAFSPIVGISPQLTRAEDIAPKIASALYRVFYIHDSVEVILGLDGRPRNIALENEILEAFTVIGRWNQSRTQIMMDLEDIYKSIIVVLSNIRGYVQSLTQMTEDYAYGLEMRYILLDAFMKVLEESNIELKRISSVYAARDALPEPKLRNILSYIKIRGDGSDIDPRFVFKVEDSRKKLIAGHQPYVFSSAFAGDSSISTSYQYDMIGPVTRVFTPLESNQNVGMNIPEMVEELDRGRDICALALGPSGAGKTSTFLYFRGNKAMNVPPQNGAIPVMLSLVSREFTTASVRAVEMSSMYIKGAGPSSYWKDHEVYTGAVDFKRRSDGDWESTKDVVIDAMDFLVRSQDSGVCEVERPFDIVPRKNLEYGAITLADFLANLVDLRLNCGTTNNPDSSRSHLFVFIQLKNDAGTKTPNLVISDLAGREKSFDCASEATLETLSMNRWYPELNALLQNPIKGGLRKSTRRAIPTGEQLKDKTAEKTFRAVIQNFENVTRENLEAAINDGYAKVFFGSPMAWYFSPPPPSGKATLNRDLYAYIQSLSKFIVQDDYFLKKISQRFDNIDKQPALLQEIFRKIGGYDKIIMYDEILKYYSVLNYSDPNASAQPPASRLSRNVKSPNINIDHKGVVDYLDAVIIVNAIDMLIYGRPAEVCGIRNIEGDFINRSLDEYSQLVMTAASIDVNYGPVVHPECLPVVCKFAGLDCLLPKNVSRDIPQSAVSAVLSKGMGVSSFRPGTLFAVFLVVNASRTQPDKIVRPLYNPLSSLLDRVIESARGIDMRSVYAFSQRENVTAELTEVQRLYTSILERYTSETRVLAEYKARVEYRGSDDAKKLRSEDVARLYKQSRDNWDTIKSNTGGITELLSNPKLPSMDSTGRSLFSTIVKTVTKLRDEIYKQNQDTIPGALAFVDELVKRGMQPMVCSAHREDEILPEAYNPSWKNVLFRN